MKASFKTTTHKDENPLLYRQKFQTEGRGGVNVHAPPGNYYIFKHPHSNFKDIAWRKGGWNWFGFFWHFWIFVYFRLWKQVLLHIALLTLLGLLCWTVGEKDFTDLMSVMLFVAFSLNAGFRINSIRSRNLVDRGYQIVATNQATNADKALALFVSLQRQKNISGKRLSR